MTLAIISRAALAAVAIAAAGVAHADDLPPDFVRLKAVAPDIEQEIRYFGDHNFIGRPIAGYKAAECILTKEAAQALVDIQHELAAKGLGLKVYDCYRPQTAVDDFVAWSKNPSDETMRAEFYPRVEKDTIFEKGYLAAKSGHSRGSTVDLAVVKIGHPVEVPWKPGDPLVDCAAPANERYADPMLDFGTGFDCLDEKAHHDAPGISAEADANRKMLKSIMESHGFTPVDVEWWHYTLTKEPFPDTYFDFPVTAASP